MALLHLHKPRNWARAESWSGWAGPGGKGFGLGWVARQRLKQNPAQIVTYVFQITRYHSYLLV